MYCFVKVGFIIISFYVYNKSTVCIVLISLDDLIQFNFVCDIITPSIADRSDWRPRRSRPNRTGPDQSG